MNPTIPDHARDALAEDEPAAHSAVPDIPKYAAPRPEKDAHCTMADLTGANTISIEPAER